MTSLTMYRYSVTGDFGYAGYINNKQMFRVSGAPLPDNPIKIQIGIDFYRSTYKDGSMFRGGRLSLLKLLLLKIQQSDLSKVRREIRLRSFAGEKITTC